MCSADMVFPPATVLVLLGDQLGNSYQAAQLSKGVFAPRALTVTLSFRADRDYEAERKFFSVIASMIAQAMAKERSAA